MAVATIRLRANLTWVRFAIMTLWLPVRFGLVGPDRAGAIAARFIRIKIED